MLCLTGESASPRSGLGKDFVAPRGTAAALSSSKAMARSMIHPQRVQNQRDKRLNLGGGQRGGGWWWQWEGVCAGLRRTDGWMGICEQGGEGSPVPIRAQPCPATEGTCRAEFGLFPQGNSPLPRTQVPKPITSTSSSQGWTLPIHPWLHVTTSPIATTNVTHGDETAGGEQRTLHPWELPCDGSSLGTEGWVAHPLSLKVTHVAAARIDPSVFGQCGCRERAWGDP